MEKWITQELERTELGDKRRTKRLIKIVKQLSSRPNATVPEASETWAATKATYDFFSSPYLKPSMITQGHREATIERIGTKSVVLAIQDTTELNYTSHKALSGAGYLDSKYASGFKVHSTLAITDDGLPLGIIGQYVWARELENLGKSEARHQKPTAQKESQKWLDALEETQEMIPQGISVVTIADREADIYDLFAHPRRQGSEFLIRATQNRCLESHEEKLWEVIKSTEPQGTMTVNIKRTAIKPSRDATLTIRSTTLTIQPPQNRSQEENLVPIELQAILVTEENSPQLVEETITWLLLTSLSIKNIEDVKKYVRWYSYRWLIERFHYVLKSGCQIEKLQLRNCSPN